MCKSVLRIYTHTNEFVCMFVNVVYFKYYFIECMRVCAVYFVYDFVCMCVNGVYFMCVHAYGILGAAIKSAYRYGMLDTHTYTYTYTHTYTRTYPHTHTHTLPELTQMIESCEKERELQVTPIDRTHTYTHTQKHFTPIYIHTYTRTHFATAILKEREFKAIPSKGHT